MLLLLLAEAHVRVRNAGECTCKVPAHIQWTSLYLRDCKDRCLRNRHRTSQQTHMAVTTHCLLGCEDLQVTSQTAKELSISRQVRMQLLGCQSFVNDGVIERTCIHVV